ncbi:Pleckstrin homology domain-containing protein [Lipomyces kononenkoae]|uniref:Pleckstrin homology domain-containing protein n=1 Tax=Lipomyces kononenkoae TaxID=34357 RepID=A0ACC3T389_LIPKO
MASPIEQAPPFNASSRDVPFTSFRLSHANASHIHDTSRVVLIGPIPSDWLRRHQKIWLARVTRSSDQEFKAAWSSVFPDTDPPPPPAPPPAPMGNVTVPPSLRRGSNSTVTGSGILSSTLKGTSPIAMSHSNRRVSYSAKPGQLSARNSQHESQNRSGDALSVKKLRKSPMAGPSRSLDNDNDSHKPASNAASRSSSHYVDVESRFPSSADATPTESQYLSEPLRIGSPTPFTRYGEGMPFVEVGSSRGRSIRRFSSSGGSARPSSAFEPSSYTSTQSFATARGSVSRSESRRALSPPSSSIYSRRSRSQESTASTIRPIRTIPTPVATSISAGSLTTLNHLGIGIMAHFQNVPQNSAMSSLASILQRDNEGRRLRSASPTLQRTADPGSVLERRRTRRSEDEDEDHRSHESGSDSLRELEFNFLPERTINNSGDVYDVVVDGSSLLGAIGPELAIDGSGDNAEYRLQKGQVVMIDRVLVGIKSANVRTLPSDFNESDHVHLNVVERAREYLVVARYLGEEHTPFVLQLYKTLIAPAISTGRTSTSVAYTIPLDRKVVNINLFSSLDKSLALWKSRDDNGKVDGRTTLYVLRFRAPSTSMAWYGFVRSVLGGRAVKDMIVQVPDLEASLRITIPWEDIRRHNLRVLADTRRREEGEVEEPEDVNGSHAEQTPISHIADYAISTALDILERVPAYRETVTYWRQHERLGLAWRRYDRIEWLHDVNEQHMFAAWALRKTHELELRPKVHYPTFAPSPAAPTQSLVEPPPIEGFLIRLTQHSGNSTHLGRLFYKQFYFMCHDNLLVFCKPHHATPPAFEKPFSLTDSSGSRTFIHEFTPYPIKDGQIEWLDGTRVRDSHKLKELDEIALSEMYRRLYQMLTSSGFIDLCDVNEVRPVQRDPDVDSQIGAGQGVNFNQSARNDNNNYEDGTVTEFDDDRVFELVLKSGLVVRLQAFNKTTRDEWIRRLDELCIYWHARREADTRALSSLKADNLAQLHIDEEMESQIGESASKWEALRGIADPEIYNVCPLGFCRSITVCTLAHVKLKTVNTKLCLKMEGQLFFKIRKQATFKMNYIVICHGHLIIYEEQSRSASGVEVPKIYHKKRDIIPLKECYVYSGILTEADLVSQNNSFNISAAPGMYSLPRIYSDGTTASDDEFSRCFVLWRASSTSTLAPKDAAYSFKSQHKKVSGNNRFYAVEKLGTAGKGLMFMARSRMEKELWVSVLTDEIGRIQEKCITHHEVPS